MSIEDDERFVDEFLATRAGKRFARACAARRAEQPREEHRIPDDKLVLPPSQRRPLRRNLARLADRFTPTKAKENDRG